MNVRSDLVVQFQSLHDLLSQRQQRVVLGSELRDAVGYPRVGACFEQSLRAHVQLVQLSLPVEQGLEVALSRVQYNYKHYQLKENNKVSKF